jgi:hypothetical protein
MLKNQVITFLPNFLFFNGFKSLFGNLESKFCHMFSSEDIKQIREHGIQPEEVMQQIAYFRKGFPYLKVVQAASAGNGIIQLHEKEIMRFEDLYRQKTENGLTMIKFVPASGAASRMFKSLFSALDDLNAGKSEEDVLIAHRKAHEFYERLDDFAFASELKSSIEKAGQKPTFTNYLKFLLTSKGLNYGNLPKGLLLFHKYEGFDRTPFEEHLVEGANYTMDEDKNVKLHFTISPEHEAAFKAHLAEVEAGYEIAFGAKYQVTFSQQKPSTDTIAVDHFNEPHKEKDGRLLFRPAGHGALLENLNVLDADLIFIKNIDNVVPDKFKQPTCTYKKVLAGLLLHFQDKIFEYQKILNENTPQQLESGLLAEASNFLENTLNVKPPKNQNHIDKEEWVQYLKGKFNRPFRVCGMVKNQGEPGGGPFFAVNSDGTVSLQIAESVQIDPLDPIQVNIAHHATYFNPVDLVCAVKDFRGEKYNLLNFRDPQTGFISHKSKDGKELKALELPGLWNGAMSDWNTLFVEVPVATFNPVKIINDLLRKNHQ